MPSPDRPRAPEPAEISVARLRALLDGLPDSWQLSVEDPNRVLLLDVHTGARGFIDFTRGRIVYVDPLLLDDAGDE